VTASPHSTLFVDAGYEVHLNLSPVIVHENWLAQWAELLDQVANQTSERTRSELAAEIVFLTHEEGLHARGQPRVAFPASKTCCGASIC
jgi:hypothetical protein